MAYNERKYYYYLLIFNIAILILGTILYILYCDEGCHYSTVQETCTNYQSCVTSVTEYKCYTGFYCEGDAGKAFCWQCSALLPYGDNKTCSLSKAGYDENNILFDIKKAYPQNASITIYYNDEQCKAEADIRPPGVCIFGIFCMSLAIVLLTGCAMYAACYIYGTQSTPSTPRTHGNIELTSVAPPSYDEAARERLIKT